MTEMDMLRTDQDFDHTDIFIIADNDKDIVDFVTIDDTFADLSDIVMIDMSNDEMADAFTIDARIDSDLFVTVDNDVIVSTFTDEDFNSTIIDFDITNDIHEI